MFSKTWWCWVAGRSIGYAHTEAHYICSEVIIQIGHAFLSSCGAVSAGDHMYVSHMFPLFSVHLHKSQCQGCAATSIHAIIS